MAYIQLPAGTGDVSHPGIIARLENDIVEVKDEVVAEILSLIPGSSQTAPPSAPPEPNPAPDPENPPDPPDAPDAPDPNAPQSEGGQQPG